MFAVPYNYCIYLTISRVIFPLTLTILSKIFAREGVQLIAENFWGKFFSDSKTITKVCKETSTHWIIAFYVCGGS